MTLRNGLIKTLLLTLLAVLTALPVRSQATGRVQLRQDSARTARMDSIYNSLNDSASWEREMEFVRNLRFDQFQDSDLVRVQDDTPADNDNPRHNSWKEIEQEKLDQFQRNATLWEPEPRVAVWLSLLVPGGDKPEDQFITKYYHPHLVPAFSLVFTIALTSMTPK